MAVSSGLTLIRHGLRPRPGLYFPKKAAAKQSGSYLLCDGCPRLVGMAYFFWTYFRQSSMTATRMMMPEKMNCRLASMPSTVRE